MEQCDECKVTYPDNYLAPLFTGNGTRLQICGICALELSNTELGIPREKFHGEQAEHLRLLALSYREEKGIKI